MVEKISTFILSEDYTFSINVESSNKLDKSIFLKEKTDYIRTFSCHLDLNEQEEIVTFEKANSTITPNYYKVNSYNNNKCTDYDLVIKEEPTYRYWFQRSQNFEEIMESEIYNKHFKDKIKLLPLRQNNLISIYNRYLEEFILLKLDLDLMPNNKNLYSLSNDFETLYLNIKASPNYIKGSFKGNDETLNLFINIIKIVCSVKHLNIIKEDFEEFIPRYFFPDLSSSFKRLLISKLNKVYKSSTSEFKNDYEVFISTDYDSFITYGRNLINKVIQNKNISLTELKNKYSIYNSKLNYILKSFETELYKYIPLENTEEYKELDKNTIISLQKINSKQIYTYYYIYFYKQYITQPEYNNNTNTISSDIIDSLTYKPSKVYNKDNKIVYDFKIIYNLSNSEKVILFPQYADFTKISLVIAYNDIGKLSDFSYIHINKLTENLNDTTPNDTSYLFKDLYMLPKSDTNTLTEIQTNTFRNYVNEAFIARTKILELLKFKYSDNKSIINPDIDFDWVISSEFNSINSTESIPFKIELYKNFTKYIYSSYFFDIIVAKIIDKNGIFDNTKLNEKLYNLDNFFEADTSYDIRIGIGLQYYILNILLSINIDPYSYYEYYYKLRFNLTSKLKILELNSNNNVYEKTNIRSMITSLNKTLHRLNTINGNNLYNNPDYFGVFYRDEFTSFNLDYYYRKYKDLALASTNKISFKINDIYINDYGKIYIKIYLIRDDFEVVLSHYTFYWCVENKVLYIDSTLAKKYNNINNNVEMVRVNKSHDITDVKIPNSSSLNNINATMTKTGQDTLDINLNILLNIGGNSFKFSAELVSTVQENIDINDVSLTLRPDFWNIYKPYYDYVGKTRIDFVTNIYKAFNDTNFRYSWVPNSFSLIANAILARAIMQGAVTLHKSQGLQQYVETHANNEREKSLLTEIITRSDDIYDNLNFFYLNKFSLTRAWYHNPFSFLRTVRVVVNPLTSLNKFKPT